MDKTELTEEERLICLFLKEQGLFSTFGANIHISISPDGSEIKFKREIIGTRVYRKKMKNS